MSRTIVVIPCYNESKRLDVPALQEFGQRGAAELLFVNDGSRDNTLDVLTALERRHPRTFRVLNLPKNSGKAEAVRQGLLSALATRPDYVGFWDADLATPLSDIEPFCRVLDTKPQIELVIGTRLRLLGHKIERQPLRYWLGRLFANTASLALGARIFDTQCGAKMFRVTPQLAQLLEEPFRTRWIFDVEIFARLQQARRANALEGLYLPPLPETIYEFPLDAWHDVAGSTLRSGDFLKASLELAGIYWTYLRPGAPTPPPAPLPRPLPATHREKQAA